MESTHITPLATFRRLPNKPKLCSSELIGCDICFDTGSPIDIIPYSLLESLREKGYPIEDVENIRNVFFSDGTSHTYDNCKLLALPLSESLWYRSSFYVGDKNDTHDLYLLLGRKLLTQYVLHYTRDTVNLLDTFPEGFTRKVPLELDNSKYYVTFSVNGREHRFYMDTGHADAITLPEREKVYAISPIHEIETEFYINGKTTKVIDQEEERGLVEIADITRHGPIVYADYFNRPCWFNPARIYAEFVIDLDGKFIAFKDK